jgi:hypothetical protein
MSTHMHADVATSATDPHASAELIGKPQGGVSPIFVPQGFPASTPGVETTARVTAGVSAVATSTWEMSVLAVPGQGASREQLMAFLHNQLDCMEAAAGQGRNMEVMDGLSFLGSGLQDRRQGGARMHAKLHLSDCFSGFLWHTCMHEMHVATDGDCMHVW